MKPPITKIIITGIIHIGIVNVIIMALILFFILTLLSGARVIYLITISTLLKTIIIKSIIFHMAKGVEKIAHQNKKLIKNPIPSPILS